MEIEQKNKPKFFPLLNDVKEPTTAEDAVDVIAFVLAGIDPAERHNLSHRHAELRSLAADASAARIGSSSALRDDHKYILAPQFNFTTMDFEDVWQDAKQIPSGQEATEFLKLAKQLRRLEIDAVGSELHSSKNTELIQQVREHAHRLLHRAHRNAVRHIEELLNNTSGASTPPWYGSIPLNRFPFDRCWLRRLQSTASKTNHAR